MKNMKIKLNEQVLNKLSKKFGWEISEQVCNQVQQRIHVKVYEQVGERIRINIKHNLNKMRTLKI